MVLPGRQTRTGLIKERQKATEDGRCGPLYHLCLEDCNNRKRRVRVGSENKVRVIGKPISFSGKREWRFCRSCQMEMTGFILNRRSPKSNQRERILHLTRSMA